MPITTPQMSSTFTTSELRQIAQDGQSASERSMARNLLAARGEEVEV